MKKKSKKWGFGPKNYRFFLPLLLEAEISRFSDQSQNNSKSKIVDNHWG